MTELKTRPAESKGIANPSATPGGIVIRRSLRDNYLPLSAAPPATISRTWSNRFNSRDPECPRFPKMMWRQHVHRRGSRFPTCSSDRSSASVRSSRTPSPTAVGLRFVLRPEGITAVWPASGVALALMALTERRRWFWVLLGAALAEIPGNMGVARPIPADLLLQPGQYFRNVHRGVHPHPLRPRDDRFLPHRPAPAAVHRCRTGQRPDGRSGRGSRGLFRICSQFLGILATMVRGRRAWHPADHARHSQRGRAGNIAFRSSAHN